MLTPKNCNFLQKIEKSLLFCLQLSILLNIVKKPQQIRPVCVKNLPGGLTIINWDPSSRAPQLPITAAQPKLLLFLL